MERERSGENASSWTPPIERGSERWKRILRYGLAYAVAIPLAGLAVVGLTTGFDYHLMFSHPLATVVVLTFQVVASAALGVAVATEKISRQAR